MKSGLPLLTLVCTTALLLSWLWRVPYLYTLIGFVAWALIGHLVTIDDDFPGGWSNPLADPAFPWKELIGKAALLATLLAMAAWVPQLRGYGGAP